MTKFSVITALLLGSAVAATAADDLASAFKEGKLDGRVRINYVNTNWDPTQWGTKNNEDSKGGAIGGSLVYQTAALYGLSAGAGAYTTHSIGFLTDDTNGVTNGYARNTTGSDLFARGPGSATNFGAGYSVLAQAYLQYDIAKTKLKGGRFLMTNPWISPNDTKMIPIAIEGYEGISNDLPNTTIQVDYASKVKERGMSYFGTMADTLDVPDAIKNYYRTNYTTSATSPGGNAPGVSVVGIKNKSINALELQAWGMHWENIIDQAMAEANYSLEAGDVILSFGGRYMQQMDRGAGDIIKPGTGDSLYGTSAVVKKKGDSDNSVDTHLFALRTVASYQAARFMVAYSRTASGGDMIAPWRGFPTDGYTRSMTITDWNANTKAYKAQFDYDFNNLVAGLSTFISYSYYNRDPSKVGYVSQTDRYYGNGDTHQWNCDVKYAVPTVKGLELKLRTMIQHNDKVTSIAGNTTTSTTTYAQGIGNDTSNKEMRIEANYRF